MIGISERTLNKKLSPRCEQGFLPDQFKDQPFHSLGCVELFADRKGESTSISR